MLQLTPSRRKGSRSFSEKRTSATDRNWCTNLLDSQFGEIIIIVSSLSFRGPPPPRHRLFPFSIFRFSCSLFCGFRLVSTVGRVTFSNASTSNCDRWSMSLTVFFFLFFFLLLFFFEETRPQVETEGVTVPQPPEGTGQKRRFSRKNMEKWMDKKVPALLRQKCSKNLCSAKGQSAILKFGKKFSWQNLKKNWL